MGVVLSKTKDDDTSGNSPMTVIIQKKHFDNSIYIIGDKNTVKKLKSQ